MSNTLPLVQWSYSAFRERMLLVSCLMYWVQAILMNVDRNHSSTFEGHMDLIGSGMHYMVMITR